MKPRREDSDQKDLEKKIDKMLYLDPAKPEENNSENDDNPEIKILNLDSSSKDIESEEKADPKVVDTNNQVPLENNSTTEKPSESKETDPAIVSDPPINITKDNLDQEDQDGSVDEIVAQEADEVLAVEDQIKQVKKPPKKPKSKNIFKKKRFYLILIIIILILIFAIPFTRYKVLGLFIKKDIKIEIIDSLNQTPVSGAKVSINNKNYLTNGEGDLNLTLGVGYYSLNISKDYYNSYSSNILIGLGSNQRNTIRLTANGRRLSLKVLNAITNVPISSVKISSEKVTSFSSSAGLASLILPASLKKYSLIFSANGFNNQDATLSYSPSDLLETVKMVPSGKIYYLSQSNGLINVVGSNLDGTSSKVLLAGTSSMSINTTLLYPSSNLDYLVLQAQRSSSGIGLYLINTKTGTVNEFDSVDSNHYFTPIGWINNYFVYELSDYNMGTLNTSQIKSYDALDQQNIMLDQSQASGSGSNQVYQQFSFFNIIANQLVYVTQWFQSGTSIPSNTLNTIRIIDPNGTNKKDVFSVNAQTNDIESVVRNLPNSLYFGNYDYLTNQPPITYSYSNGLINSQSSLGSSVLYAQYPSYHLASNGILSAWSQDQNGNPTVFWADQNGSNKKQSQIPYGYSVVGWYNNTYLILSKSNKLYVAYYQGEPGNPLLVAPYAGLSISN